MKMRIIRKSDLAGTPCIVRAPTYETFRFLLDSDETGVTVTDIVLHPGVEAEYGYEEHIEIVYCSEGRARLSENGAETPEIVPVRCGLHRTAPISKLMPLNLQG